MSFDFIDENNGYLLTYDELSITTNAGNDWMDSDLDLENYYNLIDVFMVSPEILYYLVTDKTSKNSTVFKTIDGGNKWEKIYGIKWMVKYTNSTYWAYEFFN